MTTTIRSKSILAEQRVALAGRLASMTRQGAVELIEAHGGAFVPTLTHAVTLLVVGCQGWPLAPDGRVSRKLRRARWLIQNGQPITILGEQEFLERITGQQYPALYSLAQLSQILAISGERLRAWARAGLIQPVEATAAISYFEYGQVARAKSLSDLLQVGIRPSRLRQSLARLRQWIGVGEESLSQLAVLERFGHVVVRLPNGALAEPNGQLRFEFSEEPGLAVCAFPEETPGPDDWFDRGLRAEDQGDYTAAAAAYRQALALGGPSADPCFNLANALYMLGKRAAAAERFRQVLELDPGFSEAWNNLGTVLAELGESEESLAAFRSAIQVDPHFADAHYNLADALEDLGLDDEARVHWQAYLRYDMDGPWAQYARDRLSSGRKS